MKKKEYAKEYAVKSENGVVFADETKNKRQLFLWVLGFFFLGLVFKSADE